jgi:hypothetical protein
MYSDDQLTQFITKRFNSWSDHKKNNVQNRHIENYKLYKSYRDEKLHIWQTNVFLPYVFGMIETILPRLVGYLWQGDKLVKAYPRGKEDTEDAIAVDKLLAYQVDTQIPNLFLEWVELLKTSLIQGTGIGKLTWDVMNDQPLFHNIDIFDFVPQPFKKYVNEMEGCFHVYDISVDLLEGRPNYKNLDKIKHSKSTVQDQEANKTRDAEVGKSSNYQPDRNSALIYQYWGKIPVQDRIDLDSGYNSTKYEEGLVEIANKIFIIRNEKNPYVTPQLPEGLRPFVVAKNYVDLNEFWGIGDIDPIRDLQYEANEIENQKLDSIKLIMNPMWKVSDQAGVDLNNIISYPGNIIQYSEGSKGLENVAHQEIPQSVFTQQEWFTRMISNAIGVSDYSKGQNAPGMSDTVGGITSLVEEANMRFAYKIKCIQMTAIKEFAEKLFQLDQIFIKGMDIPVRLEGDIGQEWVTITPDNMKTFVDIRPLPISMIGNKLARQNTLIRLMEVLKGAPPLPTVVKGILDEFQLPNVDEIMSQMYMLWGIPEPGEAQPPVLPGQEGIPLPGGAQGQGSPSSPGMPPPEMSNANAMQNMSKRIAVGLR